MAVDAGLASQLGLAVASLRLLLGVLALATPARIAQPWIGRGGDAIEAQVLGRALGGRDVALGLGALASARSKPSLKRWVAAATVADLTDATATVLAFPRLPRRGRLLVLAASAGAAGFGAVASTAL